MAHSEIHLELLLSKTVIDPNGESVGRIEEVRVERLGDEWIVREYLLGPAALLERLSAHTIGRKILHLLGARKISSSYRVPWDKLDLTDPEKPRLLCNLHELKSFSTERQVQENIH